MYLGLSKSFARLAFGDNLHIAFFLKEEFNRSIFSKIIALFAYPVLRKLKRRLDPRKYNGAVLIGLNGLVIKSHGGADEIAGVERIRAARNQ